MLALTLFLVGWVLAFALGGVYILAMHPAKRRRLVAYLDRTGRAVNRVAHLRQHIVAVRLIRDDEDTTRILGMLDEPPRDDLTEPLPVVEIAKSPLAENRARPEEQTSRVPVHTRRIEKPLVAPPLAGDLTATDILPLDFTAELNLRLGDWRQAEIDLGSIT